MPIDDLAQNPSRRAAFQIGYETIGFFPFQPGRISRSSPAAHVGGDKRRTGVCMDSFPKALALKRQRSLTLGLSG
ncbi:hypothetical protein FHS96_005575 [Sphingomonas zeicaulis]|uniref:hypothetical protein n=1 Tax=Sphingomonas zeicaulis TaxID=1632740 RepID=UPI003D1FB41D